MDFSLALADKDLFAVYQTIYSNADIEMWYDWNRRLNDTKWTDQCYFVMLGGKKVGGIVLTGDRIMYPFLIPPFCDRLAFWAYIMKQHRRKSIRGVSRADADILLMFDNKIAMTGQVMCRPADMCDPKIPNGFYVRALNSDADFDDIATVMTESYKGGICEEINGVQTFDEAVSDIKRVLDIYAPKNFSHAVFDASSNKAVAVCLAGVGKNYTHNYAEIAELCVMPEYRGKGLARYMIENVLSLAYGVSPFVKLFVYAGNSAEYLYVQEGFIAGPQFINMSRYSD